MQIRAKILGHPIHDLVVVFPLGLLAAAVVFDLLAIWQGNPGWSNSAFYMMGGGVAAGLIAAACGFMVWLAIPARNRTRVSAVWRGLGHFAVISLFAASWYLRSEWPATPSETAVTLSFAGAGIGLLMGWLGDSAGELLNENVQVG